MSESYFDYYLSSCATHIEALMNEIRRSKDNHIADLTRMEKKYSMFTNAQQKVITAERQLVARKLKEKDKLIDRQAAEIRELKEQLEDNTKSRKIASIEDYKIRQACSLAVFDSLLFAMEEWAVDDVPASDFRLVSQSLIFKIVYEPIMRGEEDYYIEKVPVAALEIVKRGREYISSIRKQYTSAMTDPSVWQDVSEVVHEWWLNDALPLLYGARDDDWSVIVPYSLEEMLAWRDQPAARALDFPLVWDGTELVAKYGDQIRENTGIGEFQNKHMQTRLTSHEQ